MAAANPAKTLQDEVTCPICLEYFKDPVSLDCDHSFCRACITQCWGGFHTDISCPQCREIFPQRNLRLNRQLRNIVEAARELRLQPEPESLCEKHREPLKLFCKEDEILICLVCDRSKEHRVHTVIPTEEAAEEFQVGNNQLFLKLKIVSEFQQLQEFLEEQKRLLLGQLAELNEEIVKIQNENITKLSKEISQTNDVATIKQVRNCSDISAQSQVLKTEAGPWDPGLSQPRQGSNVTLDPDTAHPSLILSEDRKSVRWGDTRQDLPDRAERQISQGCVLGCEGFTSGRHCWEVEVEVGDALFWAVGVVRESVGRKGWISCSSGGGIWAVQWCRGRFQVLTSLVISLPLSRIPSRIWVCLDCDQGQVTFIDAGDEAPIFIFPPGSVPGRESDPGSGWGGEPSSDCVPEIQGGGRGNIPLGS
uniref:Zinc finger protein RFP-like n=1 Tax=Gopherus agassizii TaxID=38772 RepID=A0A452GZ37_9SAUR